MASTVEGAVRAILEEAVASSQIPGAVVMAADRDGMVCSVAAGSSDLATARPMRADTLFRTASMTKAVTAVAAMQLVERGLLALDRPAGDVLPELASPMVLLPPDGTGQHRLRPARRPVTLRHLLTHTSGFGYDTWNRNLLEYARATGLPRAISGRLAALGAPLVRDPGEAWEYGIGIDWAGRMVEAVSGEALPRYMQRHVFDPLAMTDTGYDPDEAVAGRLAAVHHREPDGTLRAVPNEPLPPAAQREFTPGGGGLFSTGADYGRLLRMLLMGGTLDGRTILSPDTVALMGRNHIGELAVTPLRTAVPALSADVDLFPGTGKTWGLSFLRTTEALPSGRGAGSLCWSGLYNTSFWLDPGRGMTGLVLTQLLPFGDPAALDVAARVERAIYDRHPG